MKTPCLAVHVDRRVIILAIAATCLANSQAPALGQTFAGVGLMPNGTKSYAASVSNDGSVVVGTGNTTGGDRVFRWIRRGGIVSLGTLSGGTYSNGGRVSHDGTVVVGTSGSALGTRAFRWSANVMQDLGTLPAIEGGATSLGFGISGDGHVVVGMGDDNDSPQLGIKWSSSSGMVRLGTLGGPYSIANATNLDGSVVVGDSTAPGNSHAFRWTAATGMVDLGTLAGGTGSVAYGVGDDGAVSAGISNTYINGLYRVRAARWITDGGGATTSSNLGVLVGMTYSRGYGLSNDGAVVVGLSGTNLETERATMWNASMGMVDLNVYLPTIGINLTGWTLTAANGISGDGRTIVGNGTHNGVGEGWVATIPAPPACFAFSAVQDAVACAGGTASFSVTATGSGPFTYRWRRSAMTIGLAVHPSASTATLQITDVSAADAGSYDCVVYNDCTTLTSNPATLSVFTGGTGDGNLDGVSDGADIGALVATLIQPGAPSGPTCAYDMNADGAVTLADIPGFVGGLLGS